jgi:HEAT repeat protein
MANQQSTDVSSQDAGGIQADELAIIIGQIKSKDVAARKDAIDDLALRGLETQEALSVLIQALDDEDIGVRGKSARVISKLNHIVLPVLLEAVNDRSPKVRQGVVAAITVLDVPLFDKLPVLLSALQDEDSGVRLQAAWGTGRLGPEAYEAIPFLAQMVKRDETQVRVRAIQALKHIGWKVKDAVSPLGLALADPDESVKVQAAHALSVIGPNAVVVLPTILAALQDRNPMIQAYLIESLDTIGPEAYPAVPALLNALRSPRLAIRTAIIKALKRIEGSPLPSLWKVAQGDDPVLRKYALYHLDSLGELDKKGSPFAGEPLSALIGVLPSDPDRSFVQKYPLSQTALSPEVTPIHKGVCRHIQRLRGLKQLQFEYPNYDGPEGFSTWTTWEWPSAQGSQSEFFRTEVDIDDDGNQEVLVKWRSWGPHMYRRTEYIYVLSGKDLSAYFMEFENIDEATIASTSHGFHQMRYDKSSMSHAIPGNPDTVSEYARINPFTFKNAHYLLIDEGDLIVGRYRTGGRLEVACYLSAAKPTKKKSS